MDLLRRWNFGKGLAFPSNPNAAPKSSECSRRPVAVLVTAVGHVPARRPASVWDARGDTAARRRHRRQAPQRRANPRAGRREPARQRNEIYLVPGNDCFHLVWADDHADRLYRNAAGLLDRGGERRLVARCHGGPRLWTDARRSKRRRNRNRWRGVPWASSDGKIALITGGTGGNSGKVSRPPSALCRSRDCLLLEDAATSTMLT
jgi:hypothetical protein